MSDEFIIRDSGERKQFAGGMVRDTTEGKRDYLLVRDGPMYERWAEHLTKGALKYAKRNWMQAAGDEEYERFRESAVRHFEAWLRGERDEDHGAAVFFNINGAEYVADKLEVKGLNDGTVQFEKDAASNLCTPENPVRGCACRRSEANTVPDIRGRDFAAPFGTQVGKALAKPADGYFTDAPVEDTTYGTHSRSTLDPDDHMPAYKRWPDGAPT